MRTADNKRFCRVWGLVERRPPWREDYGPEWSRLPIARLRYVASKRLWTLYYHRHTGRWGSDNRSAARRGDGLSGQDASDAVPPFAGSDASSATAES